MDEPNAYGDFELAAPSEQVAEIVRTALSRDLWRIEFANAEKFEIAATLRKDDRVKGVNWTYLFHATIQWIPSEGYEDIISTISIKIKEKNHKWTKEKCASKVEEIATEIVEIAKRYEQLKPFEKQPTKFGSARWGTAEDIEKAGYRGGAGESDRLVLSPGEDEEYVTLTAEDTVKHCIVCGPTGSGKTSSIFIPNLIDRKDKSALVTEARAGSEPPDLFWKTAHYRQVAGGHKIYHFDPDDLRSNRINPLDAVDSYDDAKALAQLIVDNTTSKNNYGDDVWPKSEVNMLGTLIAHAASKGMHLGYIRAMLRDGPEGMAQELLESPIEEAREDYRGFLNNTRDGFRYGVVASLITRLGLWTNPRIVALTEVTDIDLDNFLNEKFTFYLSVPAHKGLLKPVAALIFNFLLNKIQEANFYDPPFLCLDEFTNFGMIPDISKKLSIIRHQNISVMLGFQDYKQLEEVYDKTTAETITKNPQTRVFFRPSVLESAEVISKMAGKTTIYERKMTSTGQMNERETARRLIEPEEVLNLDREKMIVFTPACPPLLLPRFGWEEYQTATQFGPVLLPEIQIKEDTIRECREAAKKVSWQKRLEEKPEPASKGAIKKKSAKKSVEEKADDEPIPERKISTKNKKDEKENIKLVVQPDEVEETEQELDSADDEETESKQEPRPPQEM